ncbi:MAG: T9SS C-terminal target domain-containing protein, partial [Crocinitomicaceae bacterium]|nr:T9SS C-terminal target domain-containing protein [Crocinitomicaceae bacterium]
LYDIAYQDPSYGGTAVFTARVMLGIDVESNTTRRSSNSLATNASVSENFVRLFPNPAKDYVNYEVILEMNEVAQFDVFDLFGRIVFSKKIDYDSKTGFIDFRGKSAGFYTYKVKMKSKSATGKLVVD